MDIKHLYCHRPCQNCPFRRDSLQGWLGSERMAGILHKNSFVCHKSLSFDQTRRQCAGHMIIKGEQNAFVSLAGSLGIELDLKGQDLIFSDKDELINHHRQ